MPDSRPLRLLVAGGGTGGHLYPGIAIAEEVRTATGGEAVFVGTSRGLESRLVPAAGFPLELVTVSGLKRMGLRGPAARAGAAAGRVPRIGAHPAPPPPRRRAGRGRLRVGAAGVRGRAARLPDGDPGAEQPARVHQPHAGAAGAACVHRVRRCGRPLRPPQGPLPRQSGAPVIPRTRRRRHTGDR